MPKPRASVVEKPDVGRISPVRSRWWRVAIAIFATLILGFEVYAPAAEGPFLFDDIGLPFYSRASADQSVSDWISGVRPVLMLSYWLNRQASDTNTVPYHATNVALHVCNTLLVFVIIRRLLRGQHASGTGATAIAAAGAGLFLLHPVQTEAVAYIAGRSETLCALFGLSAFAMFLYQPARISWGPSALILTLYGLAVLSKEQAAVWPLVMLATDVFLNRTPLREVLKNRWRLYGMLGALAIAGLVGVWWYVLRHAATAGFSIQGLSWYEYLFTQFRVWFLYLRLFVLPVNQNADYDIALSRGILDHGAIWGLMAALAIGYIAFRWRRAFPLAVFGLLVFAILLAPTSSFVPIKDLAAERRLYLPLLGLLLVVSQVLTRVKFGAPVMAGIAAVLLVCGVLTYRRSHVWGSDIALWSDAVAKSPNRSRGYTHLMYAYMRAHRCVDALEVASGTPKHLRENPEFMGMWGRAYECLDRRDEAADKFRMAAVRWPSLGRYVVLAKAYQRAGKPAEANMAFLTASRLEPRTPFDRMIMDLHEAELQQWRARDTHHP
jgi:hypothetical protein